MSVVGAALRGFGKALRRKGKVSPTIKSVKPNLKKTVSESKADEYRRRYTGLDKSDAKVKKGREMMREGQRERRRMVDTGRAFQFRHSKSYHAVDPRDSKKYVDSMKKPKPQPKFKKGKERRKGGRPGPADRLQRRKKLAPSSPRRMMKAKGGKSFPDLSGDGKVTKKDILMGRGVIKK